MVSPAKIQKYIATNAPGSVKKTPGDSLRAYLIANGGTGATMHDLEQSFLTAQSATGKSLYDKWQSYLTTNGGTGSCRDKFNKVFG